MEDRIQRIQASSPRLQFLNPLLVQQPKFFKPLMWIRNLKIINLFLILKKCILPRHITLECLTYSIFTATHKNQSQFPIQHRADYYGSKTLFQRTNEIKPSAMGSRILKMPRKKSNRRKEVIGQVLDLQSVLRRTMGINGKLQKDNEEQI